MMITFSQSGDFERTDKFLATILKGNLYRKLDAAGRKGVQALAAATPTESGQTAASWDYDITISPGGVKIVWSNSHTNGGVNIAVILQYGHGTGTGGYVAGRDYINPAIKPVMDAIADDIWKEVQSA